MSDSITTLVKEQKKICSLPLFSMEILPNINKIYPPMEPWRGRTFSLYNDLLT